MRHVCHPVVTTAAHGVSGVPGGANDVHRKL
jgi:hypothetical protein